MAISNPVTIGATTPAAASATTIVLVTTALVPAGGKIWVWPGWNSTGTISTVSDNGAGGSHTWTVDPRTPANATNDRLGLVWADSPNGLASGTSITVTFSVTSASRYVTGAYSTGVATGAATTGSTSVASAAAWTSGAVVVPNGAILIGGCYSDGGGTVTNTASGGNTEIHDQNITADSAMTTCYQIGTGASIASQGTWSAGTPTNAALCAVFPAAALDTPLLAFQPIPFF